MPSVTNVHVYNLEEAIKGAKYPMSTNVDKLTDAITDGVKNLGQVPTGTGHDNFLKGILVSFDLTFSNKAWVEAERYHFLDFVSSQSTMHRIHKFSIASQCNKYVDPQIINILEGKISKYNMTLDLDVDKDVQDAAFLDVIYNIPSGFELTAKMVTNYQQLKTIYQQRRHHRLPDWQMFCDWCETLPKFMELTQKEKENV